MTKPMRKSGWTDERRKSQSEKIRQWQPWQHATGPRTPEGKAIASRNGYKGGHWLVVRQIAQDFKEEMRQQMLWLNKL